MQGGTAANGANHLHAGPFAVGPFHIHDFIALSNAEIDGLLYELVQFAHWCQRSVAHIQACLDQIAKFQKAAELDMDWLAGVRRLGVTAGASAPELLVEQVIAACRERFTVTVEEVEVAREDIRFKLPRAVAPA